MAGTASIHDFLKRKKQESLAETSGVDWDQRKDNWLASIAQLYSAIRGFLADAIADGTADVEEQKCILKEDHIGEYATKSLVVKIGAEKIRFRPIGTLILGASGRVDMLAGNNHVMLILQEGKWKFAVRTPRLETYDLSEETFSDALRQMLE